jgi:hypothetical protein
MRLAPLLLHHPRNRICQGCLYGRDLSTITIPTLNTTIGLSPVFVARFDLAIEWITAWRKKEEHWPYHHDKRLLHGRHQFVRNRIRQPRSVNLFWASSSCLSRRAGFDS